MKNTSMTLLSVAAVVILVACGGGGGGVSVQAETTAPVVAAQTGAGAAAGSGSAPAPDRVTLQKGSGSVTQPVLDPSLATRVHAELDLIEQVLRRGDGGELETQDALEVVSDARAELKKERPNKLRLRSLLSGLARDVQVVDGTNSPSVALGRLVPLI